MIVKGRSVAVTVHSLGAVATVGRQRDAGRYRRQGARDRRDPGAARRRIDLLPKTAGVRLTLPVGIDPRRVYVRVALPGDAAEVTRLNNALPLAAAGG